MVKTSTGEGFQHLKNSLGINADVKPKTTQTVADFWGGWEKAMGIDYHKTLKHFLSR